MAFPGLPGLLGSVMPNPYQSAMFSNPLGPSSTYTNATSMLGATPTAGNPFMPVAGMGMSMLGGDSGFSFRSDGSPSQGNFVGPYDLQQMTDINKSKDDLYKNMKKFYMTTSCRTGDLTFNYGIFNRNEELQEWSMGTSTTLNVVNMAGNRQSTNRLLAHAQLAAFDKLPGGIDEVLNKPFLEHKAMDPEVLAKMGFPDGIMNFEVNENGGTSNDFKVGRDGISSYPTDEFPIVMSNQIYKGEVCISGIVPPMTPTSTTIFDALVPTRIYNRTTYELGGVQFRPFQHNPYDDATRRILNRKLNNANETIKFGKSDSTQDFVYIYQHKILVSTNSGFSGRDLCPIDFTRRENKEFADGDHGGVMRYNYPGWYQRIGILRNPVQYRSTNVPPVIDFDRVNYDRNYEWQVLGDNMSEGNNWVVLDMNQCGLFY